MRQETNNEIDLLLRRLGRRPDGSVSDPHDGHLDADELNSYAENALPPAARARYTEHLAECSSCRNLVVQLSSAAGVVVAPERTVVPASSGLRSFLASLFSPLVLRYAIPALGLAVIAVIGFTVFRTDQPGGTDVVQRSSAPALPNEQPQAPATGSASDSKLADSTSAPAATPDSEGKLSKAPTTAATPLDKNSAAAADVNAASAEPPPPKPVQPLGANTPASSPAPSAADVESRAFEVPVQKQEVQRQVQTAQEPQRERAYAERRDENRRGADEGAPAAAPAGAKPRGEVSSVRPQAGAGSGALRRTDSVEKDSDDAEIRTVAGRRFRKQRGVWVDTAYDSSTETTNLTRGSERYRALIADEPGIKTIADQLDGEVIVVWKGRVYRIR